jgi:hypothetical protein
MTTRGAATWHFASAEVSNGCAESEQPTAVRLPKSSGAKTGLKQRAKV